MNLAPTFTKTNQNVYDSLYVSLLDGLGTLQLLIAVCENDRLRFDIIERYEQALKEEARGFRITLDPAEPSLRQSLQTLTDRENLAVSKSHFVTVLGAERLDEASLNKFWGYLQWTREGLRALACPIVLWIPQRILREMVKKAPDFWRWRNGVFLFTPPDSPDWEEKPLPLRETLSGRQSGLFSPEQLEDSLQRGLIAWGEESPKLIPIYAQLGDAYVQKILRNQGAGTDAERAEFLLKQAISKTPNSIQSYNNLAFLYKLMGRYEEALPLSKKVLEITKEKFGEDHLDTAASYNNLALLYDLLGQYEEALPMYKSALEIRKEQLGERHSDTVASYNNLALLYESMGRYEEALPLLELALAICKDQLGKNHPDTASSYDSLAGLYYSIGRYEEALPMYQLALEIRKEQLGERHPDTAASYNNLAGLYYSIGRYEEALPMYQLALEIKKEQLGERHPDTATSYNNLALVYKSIGQYEAALSFSELALKIHKEVLGECHPSTATSYSNLASLYYLMGRYEKALRLYQLALKILQSTLGPDHPQTQRTRAAYENLLREKNNA